jgi:hypothetical protein
MALGIAASSSFLLISQSIYLLTHLLFLENQSFRRITSTRLKA